MEDSSTKSIEDQETQGKVEEQKEEAPVSLPQREWQVNLAEFEEQERKKRKKIKQRQKFKIPAVVKIIFSVPLIILAIVGAFIMLYLGFQMFFVP